MTRSFFGIPALITRTTVAAALGFAVVAGAGVALADTTVADRHVEEMQKGKDHIDASNASRVRPEYSAELRSQQSAKQAKHLAEMSMGKDHIAATDAANRVYVTYSPELVAEWQAWQKRHYAAMGAGKDHFGALDAERSSR